jgi:K(+)-stimulated pyrophosphate-energized sodium pump
MNQDQLSLTPEALRTYNRWHATVGLVLLLLLVLLPAVFNIGPNRWKQCAAETVRASAPAAPAAVVPAAAPPAPPAAAPAAPLPKAVVFFDTGKAAVTAQGLDALKTVVSAAGGSARLAISGFHDAKGDPAKNAELAKRRAMAVRDALKTLGVAEDRIELRKPEATSAASGPQADAQARRVEVSILP